MPQPKEGMTTISATLLTGLHIILLIQSNDQVMT